MGVLHLFGGPLLNPMIAGAAMSFSSVSVVLNALKIKTLESITIKEIFYEKEYNLEGIKCAGCCQHSERTFSNVPGVTNVEVSLENKVATVEGRRKRRRITSIS